MSFQKAPLQPEQMASADGLVPTAYITDEAALRAPGNEATPVRVHVSEGDQVTRGATLAAHKKFPNVSFVSPVAGTVARVSLRPGGKLSEIILFRAQEDAATHHDTSGARTISGLRDLLQTAGFWPRIQRRPFGGMPCDSETAATIFVMAVSPSPEAADLSEAMEDRCDDFQRGIVALGRLTAGRVVICVPSRCPYEWLRVGRAHADYLTRKAGRPHAAPGICVHQVRPAGLDFPVWEVFAEDVADIGCLLATGVLPMQRWVRISGERASTSCTIRTHLGADLRELTRRVAAPGPHALLSGPKIGGYPARWLDWHHREITVLPIRQPVRKPHWLETALNGSTTEPVIPSAALNRALGGILPATMLIRAIEAGDHEAVIRLGGLSLLPDDLAMADYAVGASGALRRRFREVLCGIAEEYSP
ncbi:Na(+)-translocating NADH-quinone reductase subunit A [Roseivivax sp. CAU 1761]